VNTVGPFQDKSYGVAEACIRAGCNYVDLADSRQFVVGIKELNDKAKKANVLWSLKCSWIIFNCN